MFNKKKTGKNKILQLQQDEDHKKDLTPKKRKLIIPHEDHKKPPVTQNTTNYNDIDLSKYSNDPLLTSTNNVTFLKQILDDKRHLVSNLDTTISDEDKIIVRMMLSIKNFLPKPDDFHITLTYAQSLDSKIGYRFKKTPISHIETKQMTHFLRYHHDGIVVGYNTFIEDNPNLNLKFYEDTMNFFLKKSNKKIIPIILDPKMKIKNHIKEKTNINLKNNYLNEKGSKAIFVCLESCFEKIDEQWLDVLSVPDEIYYNMHELFRYISERKPIKSFMIEGGASIINHMLEQNEKDEFIDTLIITIAPIFLGDKAVQVSPGINKKLGLRNVEWVKGTTDTVILSKK
ncbi:uncharacterized protein HGUI_00539 [Hanseniaspora guilliermondii]|uniref:2,5-diamino-6-ribosylamino-4(3H)-pyrimidinone 5'-phosphate reductase n=1 Tax=Hanseniaspora guilliermondii TaxID=56406 RepID=A0A1L0B066_9ASCO|nr:uncharacterized protein HGUI_00539 [Hanseniaspora guilliermondii]